jgi:hypothetical protein
MARVRCGGPGRGVPRVWRLEERLKLAVCAGTIAAIDALAHLKQNINVSRPQDRIPTKVETQSNENTFDWA